MELDDLLNTEAAPPAEVQVMTLEQLNQLQDRILRIKRGEKDVPPVTRDELKLAYATLRQNRAGATAARTRATKASADPPIDLDSLFGPSGG